jgi:hypothetical protein
MKISIAAARRAAALLGAALALSSCILAPGKFTSQLELKADRTFTYSYTGDVIAQDMPGGMGVGSMGESESSSMSPKEKAAAEARKIADQDRKSRAVADQLKRELGMKEAKYLGNGKFRIDYEISGTLTHSLVFPFNTDAEAIMPFFAIELRRDGTARMKALGYVGQTPASPGMPGMGGGGNSQIDGQFSVVTDARVQMHNAEAADTANPARQRYSWTISPITKDAPSLTVKF